MKHTLTALVLGVALLLASGGSGYAQDFQKGLEAARKGDFATALREWRPLAEQGDAKAQHYLAWLFQEGRGVTKKYKEAAKWYRKSAEQGYAWSQKELGWMYYRGQGVLKDVVYTHMWFNIAASSGDPLAADAGGWRDLIAKEMTTEQLAEAQKLARECVRKKYKGC